MKITKWIQSGNYAPTRRITTTEHLIARAGSLLDSSSSSDIVGDILFVGEDGKYYVGTVEFCIQEANPDYVKSAIENQDVED